MASQTKAGPSRFTEAVDITLPVTTSSAPPDTHLWFVDHLRLVLICGVVIAHVASIYIGGWYQYHDPVPADMLSGYVLGVPSMMAEMFGLGVFFLLAGYLTPGSYDRKGAGPFLRDRLLRLGIPLLLYDLLLDPLVVYIARGRPGSFLSFYGPYLLQARTIGPVIAWFIATLLLFTLLYAAWRSLTRKHSHVTDRPGTPPSTRAILGFIIALGLLSFVVRLWWPLGWWWTSPWWLYMFGLPGAFFPQFLSLYILGCLAYRRNWFVQLTSRMGRNWSLIALIATLVSALFIALNLALGMPFISFMGGWHWQALGESLWEAFVVVGVCISSLVLFRQHWNRQGRLTKSLAASSYTVYLIHPLVIVSVASAFSMVMLYPLLKFVIVVLFVLPLSFLVSFVLRKLPLANHLL